MEEYYILIAIFLFIVLYIYSYYRYPGNVSILQTGPTEFRSTMLLEKQPIIIEHNASTLEDLKDGFFGWTPTTKFNISGSQIWHRNQYKYVAIQLENPGEIILCPPAAKMIPVPTTTADTSVEQIPDPTDAKLLAIQAKAGEIVILPFHWRYLITPKLDVKCMGIHDFITYFLP